MKRKNKVFDEIEDVFIDLDKWLYEQKICNLRKIRNESNKNAIDMEIKKLRKDRVLEEL